MDLDPVWGATLLLKWVNFIYLTRIFSVDLAYHEESHYTKWLRMLIGGVPGDFAMIGMDQGWHFPFRFSYIYQNFGGTMRVMKHISI